MAGDLTLLGFFTFFAALTTLFPREVLADTFTGLEVAFALLADEGLGLGTALGLATTFGLAEGLDAALTVGFGGFSVAGAGFLGGSLKEFLTLTSLPAATDFFKLFSKSFLKVGGKCLCFSSMNLVMAYWLEPVLSLRLAIASAIISAKGGCEGEGLGFLATADFLGFGWAEAAMNTLTMDYDIDNRYAYGGGLSVGAYL